MIRCTFSANEVRLHAPVPRHGDALGPWTLAAPVAALVVEAAVSEGEEEVGVHLCAPGRRCCVAQLRRFPQIGSQLMTADSQESGDSRHMMRGHLRPSLDT